MFCDKCGAAIGSGAQFCSSCGKAVGATSPVPQATTVAAAPADGRVQRHIQILGKSLAG